MLPIDDQNRLNVRNPRRICICAVSKRTLNKTLNLLDDKERGQFYYLRDQIIWGFKNGYHIVMTSDRFNSNKIDCWMIRGSSMQFLDPDFRRRIIQIF